MGRRLHVEISLDELVELQGEKISANKDPRMPYVGLEHIAQGEPRLLGVSDSASSVSVNAVFWRDDILFGKLRPNLKKSIRAPFDGYCSTDILVLRSREGFLPSFSGHVFQWERVFAAAVATAAGTKMPRTAWRDLRQFRVFNPSDEDEQSRIAYVLDTIDEAIQKTEAVIAKLKQIRTGMLHDLLTYGLDKDGKLRDPVAHPDQFKDSELGRIPKEWEVRRMEEVAHQITDGEHQTPRRTGSGVPLLSARNVLNGKIALDDVDFISEEEYTRISRRCCPQYGDILISCSGTIGRVCMIPEAFRCGLVRSVAIVKLQQDVAFPKFVEILVSAPLLQRQLLAGQRQLAQANLFQSEIRRLVLPLPAMTEQQAIVQKLERVDVSLQAEQKAALKLGSVKAGLMDDLLSGNVPVPDNVGEKEEALND